MKLSKQDWQKTSLGFRRVSSRLLNTPYQDGLINLKKFLNYINSNPIIKEFIDKHNKVKHDVETDFKEYQKHYGARYILPVDQSEEISFIYQLLMFHAENNHDYTTIARNYGGKTYQSMADEFNYQVVKPLIDHINQYLEEVAIELGFDKESRVEVNVTGSGQQINVANDQSTIHATQNIKMDEFKETAERLIALLREEKAISDEEKEEVIDLINIATEEMNKEKPRAGILKIVKERLSNLKEVVTNATIAALIQEIVKNLITKI